jgi:hypothetical protein
VAAGKPERPFYCRWFFGCAPDFRYFGFSARRLVVFGLSPNVGDRAALARTEDAK